MGESVLDASRRSLESPPRALERTYVSLRRLEVEPGFSAFYPRSLTRCAMWYYVVYGKAVLGPHVRLQQWPARRIAMWGTSPWSRQQLLLTQQLVVVDFLSAKDPSLRVFVLIDLADAPLGENSPSL
jgi:hypothetical protein